MGYSRAGDQAKEGWNKKWRSKEGPWDEQTRIRSTVSSSRWVSKWWMGKQNVWWLPKRRLAKESGWRASWRCWRDTIAGSTGWRTLKSIRWWSKQWWTGRIGLGLSPRSWYGGRDELHRPCYRINRSNFRQEGKETRTTRSKKESTRTLTSSKSTCKTRRKAKIVLWRNTS